MKKIDKKKKSLFAITSATLLFFFSFSFSSTSDLRIGQKEIYVNGKIFETFADTKIPSGFSILDIGASSGGSSNFLREAYKNTLGSTFGAGKTLGLDIDPAKVKKCINSGHECIRGDATRLSQNKIKVKGTTMWHVLEHLPTCEMSRAIWKESSAISTLFSSLRGPVFDQAEVLSKAGFHRYYENWRGHTCHWNASMLVDTINASEKTLSHLVVFLQPILDSDHEAVLPNGAKQDSHTYDATVHPPKPETPVQFDEVVYREMRAVAVYDSRIKYSEDIVEFETALAIRDVVRPLLLKEGKVFSCRFPGVTVNDKAECFKKFIQIQDKTIAVEKSKLDVITP